jgi:TonB family protein
MKRVLLVIYLTIVITNIFAQQIVIKQNAINSNAPFNDDSSLYPDKYGVYGECEKEPSFVGGDKAYKTFFKETIKWPNKASKKTSGKVFIKFIVEKDGRITHPIVIHSFNKLFDAEALRAVNKMPKWEPGSNNKKPERCYYYLPVSFEANK